MKRQAGGTSPGTNPVDVMDRLGLILDCDPRKVNDKGDRTALEVKKGDHVLFSKYGGTEVKLDGEDFLIMREDDILGIVEK